MLKFLITLSSASIFILTGCAETPTSQSAAESATPTAKAEVKPSLSNEAKTALTQAEADIKEAKAKKALWTTAVDAMKRAKEAAEDFDNAAVIRYAKQASEHVKMALTQTQYPMTNH